MTSSCTSSTLRQPSLILKPRRETPSSSTYRTHRRRVGLRRDGGTVIRCDYTRFEIKDVGYRSPGTQVKLLKDFSFSLREKSLGLMFGQSGSCKTTLLQFDYLDWKAHADMVRLLKHVKRKVTILVSHDLRELAALVDQSLKMEMSGILQKDSLPI